MTKLTELTSRPASDAAIEQLAQTVLDRLAHTHPQPGGGEDLYCLNLTSYMGERMGGVLVRLQETTASLRAVEARTTAALALIDQLELGDLIKPSTADDLRRALGETGGDPR